ncbi:MAG: hypothetical protein L0G87_16110 [Renibacterium salmoninarum]|nr:hypothetical protein [Renibacterium salmoninarum]
MTEKTDQNPVEESFKLEAEEIARGNLKLLHLGHRPYVLIRPTYSGNEGYRIAVETGGGFVIDELAAFLDITIEMLRDPGFIEQWAEKIGQQESEDSNE